MSNSFKNCTKISLEWILKVVETYWMLMCLGIAVMLAYFFPNVGRTGGIIKSQYSISYGAVAFIFLVTGFSTSTRTIINMSLRWRSHLVVQSLSFLITPTVIFAFAEIMRKADDPRIDPYILIGMIITGCTPTTVSSNVVMTRQGNGNDSLALIEVLMGNILGAFITPALVQMYMSESTGFSYGNPALNSSFTSLYAEVMKHLSLAVFLPLIVGQILREIWPKQVNWVFSTFKLNKISTFCLVLLNWSTFSTAFHQRAFEVVPTASIIMIVFLNFGFFILFSGICYIFARSPLSKFAKKRLESMGNNPPRSVKLYFYRFLAPFYFSRKDTVAVILCGIAKTVVLGVPLIDAQYSGRTDLIGIVSIPLVLYQGEQLIFSQILIPLFKRWTVRDEKELETDDFGSTLDLNEKKKNETVENDDHVQVTTIPT